MRTDKRKTLKRPGAFERLSALIKKEVRQTYRDPSVWVISFLLPLLLMLIYGYGLSMDLKGVEAVVVDLDRTATTSALTRRLTAGDYLKTTVLDSVAQAERRMKERTAELMLVFPPGFERDAQMGRGEAGLVIHGVDANAAVILRTYVKASLEGAFSMQTERGETAFAPLEGAPGPVVLAARSWFNEANTSTWYLVPGLAVVIVTLIASFIGSGPVAREWERGTMETLAVTNVTCGELLAAKTLVLFTAAAGGTAVSMATSLFLFEVPVRGSPLLLTFAFLLYTLWALAFGLFLSAYTKRQFIAMQIAVIGSYLPALILSGFIFDLRSVPAWISAVGHLMPPTYAMETVKILFLSGGSDAIVAKNLFILALWTVGFFVLARFAMKKTLE